MDMTVDLHFYLNSEEIRTSAPAGMLVLDFLRQRRRLKGTKEGCREGDCGACVVLVGELRGSDIHYKAITSCLMPVGELHGMHLVSIEGLRVDGLSPIQEAIIDEGASQCGFCTPGIVVSLTGSLIGRDRSVDLKSVKEALGGHLCRCTGYRSLKASWSHIADSVTGGGTVADLVAAGVLPSYFEEMPSMLRRIAGPPTQNGVAGPDLAIAGGTDLYVQQGDSIPNEPIAVLNLVDELKGIERTFSHLEVGSMTTFEDFSRHPDVVREIPEIVDYMYLIASIQIRNLATLGGNIINASPIGDMTILLLALGAELELQNGEDSRAVSMDRFFLAYKQIDRQPGEVLRRIRIPLTGTAKISWEKVSKRKCLDIASVNSAIRIDDDDGLITKARIAVGGVAPIPLLLEQTGNWLVGQRISAETVLTATDRAQGEISPISDVRGSADYKRLLTRQLMIAHFVKLYPDLVSVRAVYEAH